MKLISISRGPQFRNGKAVYAFLILLTLIIFSVGSLIEEDYYAFAFLLISIVLLLFYVLDIQGVDIDKVNSKYRIYKVYLWGKRGDWLDYSSYKSVKIDFELYYIKIAKFYSYYSGTSNLRGKERHDRYLIMIHNGDDTKNIIISEHIEYRNTIKKAMAISRLLNLPLEDFTSARNQQKRKRLSRRVY